MIKLIDFNCICHGFTFINSTQTPNLRQAILKNDDHY